MKFTLKVITPYGEVFSGDVDKMMIKTAEGYIGILPRHIPLVAPVEISALYLHLDGQVKDYAVSGGILYVTPTLTRVVANSCESKDSIDLKRAEAAKDRAELRLKEHSEHIDVRRAELSLQRALNRIHVVQTKH